MAMVSIAVSFGLFLGTRMILRPIEAPSLGSLYEIEDQSSHVYHSDIDSDVYLVFIHGLGGQITQFTEQIQYFSQKYNVIAIDLVGHGKSQVSDHPEDYKLDSHVERIYTILSHLNVINKKLILVGHSLGCLLGNLLSQKIAIQGFIAIAPSTNISEKVQQRQNESSSNGGCNRNSNISITNSETSRVSRSWYRQVS
jgi:pimeloyl-ACP methyl ester carboxylesterase